MKRTTGSQLFRVWRFAPLGLFLWLTSFELEWYRTCRRNSICQDSHRARSIAEAWSSSPFTFSNPSRRVVWPTTGTSPRFFTRRNVHVGIYSGRSATATSTPILRLQANPSSVGDASDSRKSKGQQEQSKNLGSVKQQQKPSRRPIFSQEAHVASFPRGEDSDSLGSEQQQFSVYPQQRRQQSVPVDRVDRRSDGQLISANAQRVATAGRVGTQRHVNPCKVYLGNLSFQVSSKQVQEWIVDIMGLPAHIVLASSNKGCHIVTDWKTGKSKGYGFVVFSEPMYATVALETLNNRLWHNRTVTASPGIPHESLAHKAMLQERFDSKQAKRLAAAEKAAKTNASTPIPVVVYMDAHEASMLARLDPDLLQGVTIRKEAKDTTIRTDDKDHLTAVLGKDQDQSKSRTETNNQLPQMESLELNVELEDDEDDDGDYDDDYDDECDDVDDDLLEWETRIEAQSGESKESAIESPMNREQRREADKRTPRRKKESKGFGS